jgi:hypothetical protein
LRSVLWKDRRRTAWVSGFGMDAPEILIHDARCTMGN